MSVKKVLVIGAGTMGNGIAQVFAQKGVDVFLNDISTEYINAGINRIEKNLDKLMKKGKLSDKNEVLDKIIPVIDIEEVKDKNLDLIVEAALEEMTVKKEIFRKLDKIFPGDIIFATNTSSLSITEIASATENPEKVIGMHFFNPVPVMALIEVVQGLRTDKKIVDKIVEISHFLSKEPVVVQDSPGFATSRFIMVMVNEAICGYFENIASPEGIDKAMKLGMNHPMGPLELADLIGLDVCLHVMEVLYESYNDSKYRPCPLLKKMVSAGYLGRKTGRGFYKY